MKWDMRITADGVPDERRTVEIPARAHTDPRLSSDGVRRRVEEVGKEIVAEMVRRQYLGEDPLSKAEVLHQLRSVHGVAEIQIHDPPEKHPKADQEFLDWELDMLKKQVAAGMITQKEMDHWLALREKNK